MQLEYGKNPVWSNSEHTMIDLIIKWAHINEELPFTASATDCEEHGRAIFRQASQGAFGLVAEYVAPHEPEPGSQPTAPSGEIPVTTV
jgi:hypothetical protein